MPNNKNEKRFIFISLLYPLPFVVILLGLLYIYDPFQIFHKPYFREATFFTDMRKQALGIIKHYKFDSYIIGTSMLETTSATQANQKIGGNFVNISLLDSYPNESAVVLDYIFQNQNPKHIIYSLDSFYNVKISKKDTSHFDYLYNKNPFDDIKIYLNKEMLKCIVLFLDKKECIGEYKIHNITSWYNKNKHRFGGFDNWIKHKNDERVKPILLAIKNSKFHNLKKPNMINITKQQEYINQYLINFIKKYTNTKFSIIIPPYLKLFYVIENSFTDDNSIHFYTWSEILKWFIKETSKLENVKVYGFDDLDYADDITNYNDLSHYNKDLNSIQLDAIKNQTNILTPQNIDKYLATMEQKIKSYDIKPFIKALENVEIDQIKQ